MKKDTDNNTSQDYDRKHAKNHISQNPRAIKDVPTEEDGEAGEEDSEAGNEKMKFPPQGPIVAEKTDSTSSYHEDKRETARHEHTNHFTNRAGKNGQ